MTTPPPVTTCNLHFDSPDFDAAVRFYRDVLGLPVKSSFENARRRGIIFAVTPTTELEFFDTQDAASRMIPAPGTLRLKLIVPDVEALHARLVAAGIAVTDPLADKPWGERSFGVQAPDGVVVHFSSVLTV